MFNTGFLFQQKWPTAVEKGGEPEREVGTKEEAFPSPDRLFEKFETTKLK